MNEFERKWIERRWRPVIPAVGSDPGEDVERTPISGAQIEHVAERGALEPGEKFPQHLEVDFATRPAYSRAERIALMLPKRWYRSILKREQRKADEKFGKKEG